MVCMASLAMRVMSRPEYATDLMLCMPSQHHAIGLHTDCMVVVSAPVVRLPDSHVYMPYGPRLRVCNPCNSNNVMSRGLITSVTCPGHSRSTYRDHAGCK